MKLNPRAASAAGSFFDSLDDDLAGDAPDVSMDDFEDFDDLPDDLPELPDDWIEDGHTTWEQDVSDTLADRDDRIEDTSARTEHEAVREYLRETGIAENIAERLEELTERETERTARRGHVLDLRNVTRRLAGDTTVKELYRQTQRQPGDDLAICLSLDMSGSMRADTLEAKAAVGVFLHAVQEYTDEVVCANAWKAPFGTAQVDIVTGPHEPFRWKHLDAVWPDGRTPTALGIWEAGMMLHQIPADIHLLITITDGTPSTISRQPDDYSEALAETADTVDDLRAYGLEVIGLGFGRKVDEDDLTETFGDQGRIVDLEEIPDELVEIFAEHTSATIEGTS